MYSSQLIYVRNDPAQVTESQNIQQKSHHFIEEKN